ncbi:MAG TPA: beta-1,3-glucanase family protein [Pseudonocardiaceae bacterium]|jgi:hypothetical protein|nr:beta-1,3-glucanase family protein [Pseudonocardiaceae bacterium]
MADPRPQSRRNFLRAAFGAAASVPLLALTGLPGSAAPAVISNGRTRGAVVSNGANTAASVLPMTFVNNTGQYANSAIWMYVVGSNSSGQQAYVTADGTLTPVTPSLNGPSGYADLSIPFAAGGNTTLNLPTMSGRIYFSINDKLQFKVVTDGNGNSALQYPAGWVSSDASYSVLHDWIEFTFINGMYCNTTMVDMFSIPLAIELNGTSQQTTGTLVAGGRDAIFSGIAAQSDFGQLVLGNGLRVLAPGHGIDAGLFSSTYFDSYVDQVWSNYASNSLNVTINSTTYAGQVSGDSLVFTNGGGTFARPTTSDIFYCAGALAPPAGNAGPVAADLGAAFNRSTLLSDSNQPDTNPADFYQNSVTNHYSRIIHENTVDGKAYGFPFDDVGSFASYVQDGSPTSMTVTLTPFS